MDDEHVRLARRVAETVALDSLSLPGPAGDDGGNGSALACSEQREAPSCLIPVYSAPDLAALTPEVTEWVVYPYLAVHDVGSLEGASKSGKSTLARKMAATVAAGGLFLGHEVMQGPTLYCSEERAGTFREGLERAGALATADLHVMFWHDAYRREWPEIVEAIGMHAHRLGAVLVIVDTLSKWAGLKGDEEQGAGHAMAVMRPLQHLAASGLCVLALRHERKSGGDVGEAGRGSTAFTGDFDVIMALRKVSGERTRRKVLAVGRHDDTPDELAIDLVDGEYRSLGDPGNLRRLEQERAVIGMLAGSRSGAVLLDEIVRRTEASRSQAQRLLTHLENEGVVVREVGAVPDHPRAAGYWLRGDDD